MALLEYEKDESLTPLLPHPNQHCFDEFNILTDLDASVSIPSCVPQISQSLSYFILYRERKRSHGYFLKLFQVFIHAR